jgi:DNA-binding response OmpR family regulator
VRILIVEDHLGIRAALEMLLQIEGYFAVGVDRGDDALALLQKEQFDLVLLDLYTDGISPSEFMIGLRELAVRQNFVRPAVGVLSASQGIESETRQIGADFMVRKPFEHEELLSHVERMRSRLPVSAYA